MDYPLFELRYWRVDFFSDEGPIRRPEGGGASEWEPIKILLKNLSYAPKSLPKNLADTCQDHVVTTDLLTLGTS
jgi:hypothetical protein